MPHPEYDPITNKWPGNPKLNAAWATWYYGHPDDDASRYIDLLGEEIATLKAEVERLQILSDESLLRDANLHLMATLQSCQEALRRVVDHVTSIRNCAHGIMPIYSELKTDLMKTIIGLNDARWTRLYAILAEAEEALAFAKGVMEG